MTLKELKRANFLYLKKVVEAYIKDLELGEDPENLYSEISGCYMLGLINLDHIRALETIAGEDFSP